MENRKLRYGSTLVGQVLRLYPGQRVFNLNTLLHAPILDLRHTMAINTQETSGRQADNRISAPLFPALDRLEQKRTGARRQFLVGRLGRFHVGKNGTAHRYATVALGRPPIEGLLIHHDVVRASSRLMSAITDL